MHEPANEPPVQYAANATLRSLDPETYANLRLPRPNVNLRPIDTQASTVFTAVRVGRRGTWEVLREVQMHRTVGDAFRYLQRVNRWARRYRFMLTDVRTLPPTDRVAIEIRPDAEYEAPLVNQRSIYDESTFEVRANAIDPRGRPIRTASAARLEDLQAFARDGLNQGHAVHVNDHVWPDPVMPLNEHLVTRLADLEASGRMYAPCGPASPVDLLVDCASGFLRRYEPAPEMSACRMCDCGMAGSGVWGQSNLGVMLSEAEFQAAVEANRAAARWDRFGLEHSIASAPIPDMSAPPSARQGVPGGPGVATAPPNAPYGFGPSNPPTVDVRPVYPNAATGEWNVFAGGACHRVERPNEAASPIPPGKAR